VILNAMAALVVLLVGLAVRRNAVEAGRVELNGFLFFSFGFLYYWIFPLLFAANAEAFDIEGLTLPSRVAQGIDQGALIFYAGMCVLAYGSFWLGYQVFAKDLPPRAGYPEFPLPARGLKGLVIVAALFAAAMVIPVREHLFRGYDESLFEGYEAGVLADALPRGTFVAAVSILFVVSFMWASQQASRSSRPRDFFLSTALGVCLVFEILVLSMGGRLYFASSLITLGAFWSVRYGRSVRVSTLVLGVVAAVAVIGAGGVLRADGGTLSLAGIATNVGQEPGLTAISLFSFLDGGRFPAVNAPIFLLGDLLNLAPSILFPDKLSWALRPQDYGYSIDMPLGGLHLFVSLIVNFGWVGALVVFGATGAALAWLRRSVNSWLGTIVYSLVCGWTTFSLFRDPFSVSLVKNILQVSILVPLLVVYGLSLAGDRRELQ
jgi:hypothetical protein